MDLMQLLVVCPLVFLGGLVDAIAGGGGLITLPAYLMAGVPPHVAIGTNKISASLGTLVSTYRFWRNGFIDLKLASVPSAAAFAGSVIGASIALLLPPEIFQVILLVLLPFVAALVLRPRTLEPVPVEMSLNRRWAILSLCAFACGAYDGFYGPGAGTFMLILFTAGGRMAVRDAAGEMKCTNFSSGLAALVTFACAGQIDWLLGIVAGVFGILGNYIGAGLVVKNGSRIVRPIIAVVLSILFAKTAWDYFF